MQAADIFYSVSLLSKTLTLTSGLSLSVVIVPKRMSLYVKCDLIDALKSSMSLSFKGYRDETWIQTMALSYALKSNCWYFPMDSRIYERRLSASLVTEMYVYSMPCFAFHKKSMSECTKLLFGPSF